MLISMCVFGVFDAMGPHYSVNLPMCVFLLQLPMYILSLSFIVVYLCLFLCVCFWCSSTPWTSLLSEIVCGFFIALTHFHW